MTWKWWNILVLGKKDLKQFLVNEKNYSWESQEIISPDLNKENSHCTSWKEIHNIIYKLGKHHHDTEN